MITKNDIIKEIPRIKNLMNELNINADINEFKKYINNMSPNEFNHIINIIVKNNFSKVRKSRTRSNNLRRLSKRSGSKLKKSTKNILSKRGGSNRSMNRELADLFTSFAVATQYFAMICFIIWLATVRSEIYQPKY